MKKWIASYHMFLPSSSVWMRLLLYVGYPALGLGLVCLMMYAQYYSFVICLALCTVLMGVELLLDYLLFAGVAGRKNQQLEYVKTSPYCMTVLKSGFKMDLLRRFLSLSIIFAECYAMLSLNKNTGRYVVTLAGFLSCAVLTYIGSVLAITIARFFSSLYIYIGILYIMETIFMIGVMVGMLQKVFTWIALIGLILLAMILSYINYRIMMKQVKESFYDERAV